jgi:hypothetical protein
MATQYRKSTKGTAEIETRAHRLTPRLRGMLIMVDGKRSDSELLTMLPQYGQETLTALVSGGFIEPVNAAQGGDGGRIGHLPVLRGLAPSAPPAPPDRRAQADAGPATTRPATLPPGTDFKTLRREAVRALADHVGPMAEALAIKMERARDVDELAPLLETAAQIVGNVRGDQAASAYRRRYGAT